MTNIRHRLVQIIRISIKEWKLLCRNPHGLAVLFLMPAIFVLVMSFALKNTLISGVEMPTTGWVIEDESIPAERWVKEWRDRYGGILFSTRHELQHALKERKVDAGVVVLRSWLANDGSPNGNKTEIWLGNRVPPAAASRLRAELTFSVLNAKMKMAAAESGPFASVFLSSFVKTELLEDKNVPSIRYLYEIESGRKMTAVQQTVPAWLIFGMFFVVIPIAGVLIQERNDRTLTRLFSLGVSPSALLGGKFVAFMILNWIQLGCMLAVGRWIVPLLGGDALYLDFSFIWFLLIVVSTSTAAVSLALFISSVTSSFDHAAALGSGLNVILGAIAGVMVPRTLMSPSLQTVSEWSPMGWALDGMQAVFLGNPDSAFMIPRIALLLLFGFFCFALSWWRLRRL